MIDEKYKQRKRDYWEWSDDVAKERARDSEIRVQEYYDALKKSDLDKDYIDQIDSWESWK